MVSFIFAIIGLLLGVVINALADDLPRRSGVGRPHCPKCGRTYSLLAWSGIGRRLVNGGRCPACEHAAGIRPVLVEVSMMILLALLPLFVYDPITLAVDALYVAIFVLVIVTDLENRLIFNVVTYPATALGLLFSFVVEDNSIGLALVGAVVSLLFFYIVYWLGKALFGPGALGYGDVKLAMAMGAMLGFHRVLFALAFGIVLGGVVSLLLIVSRRFDRSSYLPYGQYLAIAGIVMLIWGEPIAVWYAGLGAA